MLLAEFGLTDGFSAFVHHSVVHRLKLFAPFSDVHGGADGNLYGGVSGAAGGGQLRYGSHESYDANAVPGLGSAENAMQPSGIRSGLDHSGTPDRSYTGMHL